ncbi:hypothetical protein NOM73_06265 [Erwinia persicina]|uniref:hypothetical protein n=1 Tax=Erwinia persicina TaxID=55211 RepID=UPI00210E4359|nr:hypothetical protein [Erwinia persicina]MCQ4095009.1 hypothetical protein [Erwinia persicina]MCQ4100026.1 hypothetical protein [Erwinia persicina]
MKSDTLCLATVAAGWFFLCAALTSIITKGAISTDKLVVFGVLLLSPSLFKPLSRFIFLFRKRRFVLMKKRNRIWLHLNPWLATGRPGLREINLYWRELAGTLIFSLEAQANPTIILSSHLLSHRRTARLLYFFPDVQYQHRLLNRPVSRAERTGLQLEILLKEWRWFSPSAKRGILVIRKKCGKH